MSLTQTLTMNSVVHVSNKHVASNLADEIVMLNLQDGTYYGLEGVGVVLWEHIQQPITIAAIRDAILAEYDVTPEECEQDILALLADMADAGLIEVADGQPA